MDKIEDDDVINIPCELDDMQEKMASQIMTMFSENKVLICDAKRILKNCYVSIELRARL